MTDDMSLQEMSRNCTVGYFRAYYRGYVIPLIEIYKVPTDADNQQVYGDEAFDPLRWRWEIVLDGRLAFDFDTKEEIERFIPIIADGMAITAGYACHGSNNRLNAHGPTVLGPHQDTPAGEVVFG